MVVNLLLENLLPKIHMGVDCGCVLATAGSTKSATDLAKTTGTLLMPAENIDAFVNFF